MKPTEENFYRARIVERRDLSPDLWIIRVEPGGDFRFTAGQYATLGVFVSDRHIERPYSIVSSPYDPWVEFFLELVPEGQLTPELHKLQVGDTLTFRKTAKGRLTLDTKGARRNHLLLCTVTGVAPFVSYARTLYRDWQEGRFQGEERLFVLEGASRSWELGYREELENLAAEAPWLQYLPTISRPWEDEDWHGEVGRVDDLVRKCTDLWRLTPETTWAYLCGNPDMIENCRSILYRARWQKDGTKEEAFFTPKKSAKQTGRS